MGGFPAIAGNNEKVQDIKHFLASQDLDLFGGCKSNLNWKALPNHIQLWEWFCLSNGCWTFHAHNTHENFGMFQYGGTFWIAAGHATTHISAVACNSSKLGHWVSCTLLGRSGKKLVIIFAYRPCANNINKIQSVVAQHHHFFEANQRHCCPQEAFLMDLGTFIDLHRDAGAAIILLGNMNGDICHSALHSFATAHNLHETILSWFPSLLSPATFQCGSQLGTVPINGVWVLADVKVEAAQWCPIQLSPSDHCAMVININLTDCIGDPCYMIVWPLGCQLNFALPLVCNQYLHLLHNFAKHHALKAKLNSLFQLAQSPMTSQPILQQALKSFDRTKADGMKHAEQHCQRFNMGLVQYSPELNLWHRRKNLWLLVLCRKQGHPIKAKYINCLARACQVVNPLGATLFQINWALQDATMRYMALKPQYALLQSDFLQSKLHGPTLSEDHHHAISWLISLEVLHDSYRHICTIKQQSMGHSITAVKYSSPSGTVLATSHSEVEAALSHRSQRTWSCLTILVYWSQYEDTPLQRAQRSLELPSPSLARPAHY